MVLWSFSMSLMKPMKHVHVRMTNHAQIFFNDISTGKGADHVGLCCQLSTVLFLFSSCLFVLAVVLIVRLDIGGMRLQVYTLLIIQFLLSC
jgi:hypothetical protein